MSNDTPPDGIARMDVMLEAYKANPQFILERHENFPGTALLAQELMPYLDGANRAMTAGAAAPTALQKIARQQVEPGELPDRLKMEVIRHVGQLQLSADTFEAHGRNDRAVEVREVAAHLSGMLNTIQQIAQIEAGAHSKLGSGSRPSRAG